MSQETLVRPVFDVEKRVIAEGKTIQVTPDLLLTLWRMSNLAEFCLTEAKKSIDLDDELDEATLITEVSEELQLLMDGIYKHLDRNYLDTFIEEYSSQEDEYFSTLPKEDEDEDED